MTLYVLQTYAGNGEPLAAIIAHLEHEKINAGSKLIACAKIGEYFARAQYDQSSTPQEVSEGLRQELDDLLVNKNAPDASIVATIGRVMTSFGKQVEFAQQTQPVAAHAL